MIEVYIDGASAGNPGLSGAGVFINNNGKVESYSMPIGILDNHAAEFHALITALEICLDKGYNIISIRSDSTAVVNAVEKEFIRNSKYSFLLDRALQLSRRFDLFFIKWIPSKENRNADELARKAIRLN